MYTLTPQRLAFLAMINWAEGSPQYDQLFAYKPFDNSGPHPNILQTFSGGSTTAAGAYQFLHQTWLNCIAALGLKDRMSADNQDQAALHLIAQRAALTDIDNGRIESAITKVSYEWASLPPSRYPGQPVHVLSDLITVFNKQLLKKKS